MGLRRAAVISVAAVAMLAGGCAGAARPRTSATAARGSVGSITVFAAASLTGAFTDIGAAFEAAHPGASVTFDFAGSSDLVAQINQGAPADVFASADAANMATLATAGNAAAAPVEFATNRMEIITAAGNPRHLTGLGDLAAHDLIVVLCAAPVPCGSYAERILAAASVAVTPKSREANAKAVVTKVSSGEADAGIVFATDVRAAGAAASGVEIPQAQNVVAAYPMAITKQSANPTGAQAFVDFVRSPAGRRILTDAGFGPPRS